MGIAERKEREKQEMRKLILRTAAKIFIKDGFEKTSIRNIADAIEYSPATIYLYFKDKNELFYAIQKDAFHLFFQYFQRVGPMDDPMDRLLELGKVYLQFAVENPGYYDLMFIMRAPMEASDNEQKWEEGKKSHDVLHEIVNQCAAAGYFKGQDPFIVAHTIWAFTHGLASLYVRERMKMFPEETHEFMLSDALETFSSWLKKL